MIYIKHLFSQIYIPDAVYEEVVTKGEGEVGSEETESAVKDAWIIKRTVKDEIAISALTTILGKGESEVIILYKELSLDYALLDERTARDMAELMNVKTMGVIGVINLAIEQGLALDKKELIEQLREAGFRISDKLYRRMFPD